MSIGSKSGNECSVDTEELLQFKTICRELRKEKDMLRESLSHEQSINAELIRRYESDANAAFTLRSKDEYIEELERELRNSSQEIGFLQDQLSLRNAEANDMGEYVRSLELKLSEVEKLHEKLRLSEEELVQCDSHCSMLMRELERKDAELRQLELFMEKLEAEISSIALESQCEVESMKLDMVNLGQRCFEADRFCKQAALEKARMDDLLEEVEVQFRKAQQRIGFLENENKVLQEKLVASEENAKVLLSEVAEYLDEWWLKNICRERLCVPKNANQELLIKIETKLPAPKQTCTYEEVLDPFLSKLAVLTALDEEMEGQMEKMATQISESEHQVSQLKEELRKEKLKAKEEAEDLTQEMAELRYQITGMLEEERKRRACIEQASIQRIQELEAQVRKEQRKSFTTTRHLDEVCKPTVVRSAEVQHFNNELEGFQRTLSPQIPPSIDSCSCGDHVCSKISCSIDVEAYELFPTGGVSNRASISLNEEKTLIGTEDEKLHSRTPSTGSE